MSRNTLLVLVLSALVLAATALRLACGPLPLGHGGSTYVVAKLGPAVVVATVEMAASDARPAGGAD
jgi:hypothetical protein